MPPHKTTSKKPPRGKKHGRKGSSKRGKSSAALAEHMITVPKPLPPGPFVFNFGMIKYLSKPGSWRRGYGYFLVGQVQEVRLTEFGVEGSVKGNFKDAYHIRLHFHPGASGVTPECDCPLSEEWCKHSVALALVSVDRQLWEAYWGMPILDEFCPKDVRATASSFQGDYRVVFDGFRKPKRISVQLVNRENADVARELEPLLRLALDKQASGRVKLNETQRQELALMSFLLENVLEITPDGWFHLAIQKATPLFQLLVGMEEVCNPDQQRIIFEHDPLKLVLSVNVSMAGNVLISLHWNFTESWNSIPLEEIAMFGRDVPWGMRKNHLYPLQNTLRDLPHSLTKTSFTDIRDADGGKFMYEELPKLRKLVEVDEADIVEQLRLERKSAQKIIKLEMVDEVTLRLRASLSFSYDGVEVPYSKSTPETPYVMVLKKGEEKIYWVRRDLRAEQHAYDTLVHGGLEPIQTQFLTAEGDNAIDFYNVTLKSLGKDWTIKGESDFSALKASDQPLKIWAAIDFANTVDSFTLQITCRVGRQTMELEEVQSQLMQGKKYFFKPGAGYIEIPLASILQFGRTLQALDAQKLESGDEDGSDLYEIQTFKAGLIAELVEHGVELDMGPKFQKFWNLITAHSTLEEIPIPESIQATLRPYQKQGFNWLWFLYSYGLNGILADDMGLGKTLQSLVLMQHAKDLDGPKPSLIVCPSSIVFNWEVEANRFTPEMKVLKLTGTDRHGLYKKIKDADIVITSYAILRRDINALKNYEFRHIILDESQNIKNYESQTAQAAKALQGHHRLALSGTPIENRLSELWSVFDFLMPKFLHDINEFRYRFIGPIEERGNHDAERRLKKQVYPFILRRLKADVAKDLPPKIESVTYCELTDSQRELYLEILEQTREQVFSQVADKGVSGAQRSIFSALLRLRQICCHPRLMGEEMSKGLAESGKFEALQSMLEEIVSEGHRVLLYSQFVEMLKLIRPWLEQRGFRYEYLTGETPTEERQKIVERFNRDDSIPIFLISLKAGGTGLNLTGADYVIHYDPWWNPAAEDQASDRAHRIGQKKTVFVYRFITKGTVEEKIMKLKDRKRDLVDSIISADRAVGKLLSFEDLKEILTPDF